MKVRVGDHLMADGDHGRVGVVIGLRNEDGSPPYVVKWLSDGHIAMIFPGPYTRIVPCAHQAAAEPAASDQAERPHPTGSHIPEQPHPLGGQHEHTSRP